MPPLGSRALDELVSVYAEAANELATLLQLMTTLELTQQRELLAELRRILTGLQQEASDWARKEITQLFESESAKAAAAIEAATGIKPGFYRPNTEAIEALVASLTGEMTTALGAVSNLANQIMRGTGLEQFLDIATRRQVAIGMAAGEARKQIMERIARILRRNFQDGIVGVIGTDSKMHRFALDYYAGLVAHQTMRQAATTATLLRAQQADMDLVRVSPNPSTIGDYCDAYRGRVFSISGTNPRFPPLAETPNGGPPFHPWCKHSISIFVPEFHEEAEIEEWRKVDERFLLHGGDNVNRIARDWWHAPDRAEVGHLAQV